MYSNLSFSIYLWDKPFFKNVFVLIFFGISDEIDVVLKQISIKKFSSLVIFMEAHSLSLYHNVSKGFEEGLILTLKSINFKPRLKLTIDPRLEISLEIHVLKA